MRLLFVTPLVSSARSVYTMKWRSGVKLLLVSKLDRSARAVSTITKYVQVGRALGHEIALFGEQSSEEPSVPYSLDVKGFDYVIFVVYETKDFPDLPYLARLLDGVPKERRIVIDCCGRYNETVRVEHDFNHLEKIDGHQGWEWVEGIEAISDRVLQPTLRPLRSDVRPFLFHAYDPAAVVAPYGSPREAARAWSGEGGSRKPHGVAYVGHNWQRWSQIRRFLEAIEPLREELGPICLAGWRWDERPDWAAELGLAGIDVDPALLKRLGVETKWPIPFNEVTGLLGQARFAPIFHRPLFKELGLVTVRTFETFHADTIPLLMLPDELIREIYGPAAKPLAPGGDVAGRLRDMIRHPEVYWDAVFKVRAHLGRHHSYQQRFAELQNILES
jgi:hypothetical protein